MPAAWVRDPALARGPVREPEQALELVLEPVRGLVPEQALEPVRERVQGPVSEPVPGWTASVTPAASAVPVRWDLPGCGSCSCRRRH